MDGRDLQEFEKGFERQTALFKNIGQRTFSEFGMHRYNRFEKTVGCSFFEGDVAAFLAQLDKTCSLKGSNNAFARDARELGHVNARLRP